VAASRPSAWSVLTVRAGRRPASPAAPRPGTLHPDADRPVACWTGCHLGPSAVKAYLLGKKHLRDTPLTAPGPRRPGETWSPGAGEDLSPTSRQEARTVADQAGTPTRAGTC
jgi:hypothetical protein